MLGGIFIQWNCDVICPTFNLLFGWYASPPTKVRNVLFPCDRYTVTPQYTYTCIPKESLLWNWTLYVWSVNWTNAFEGEWVSGHGWSKDREWYKDAQEEARWGRPIVVGSSLLDPPMTNSLWMTLARSMDCPALT
jgi:hypothetical protein